MFSVGGVFPGGARGAGIMFQQEDRGLKINGKDPSTPEPTCSNTLDNQHFLSLTTKTCRYRIPVADLRPDRQQGDERENIIHMRSSSFPKERFQPEQNPKEVFQLKSERNPIRTTRNIPAEPHHSQPSAFLPSSPSTSCNNSDFLYQRRSLNTSSDRFHPIISAS